MFQLGGRLPSDRCLHFQHFIVPGGTLESYVDARDNKEQAQFFHLSVVATLCAKKFRATDLKIR